MITSHYYYQFNNISDSTTVFSPRSTSSSFTYLLIHSVLNILEYNAQIFWGNPKVQILHIFIATRVQSWLMSELVHMQLPKEMKKILYYGK